MNDALLTRKPYPRTKVLISKKMTKHIMGQFIYQLTFLLVLVFKGDTILGVQSGRQTGSLSTYYTIVFNTFVWLQLFNEVNCRRIHDEVNIFAGIFVNAILEP
jgi:Ca2+ transporting ATPase